MNKQEIENKLEEILYKDKELIEDIVDGKLSYGIATSFLEEINKQIFNFALELAYQNAEVRVTENVLIEDGSCYTTYDDGVISVTIDKQSILNLKL